MTAVLVDTSVWRRYFAGRTTRRETAAMKALLDEDDGVLVHEAVIGELVLGGLSTAEEELLRQLPLVPGLTGDEVLSFVKRRRLQRRGICWVDAHLLAGALVAPARLWSFDRPLAGAAEALDVDYEPPDLSA